MTMEVGNPASVAPPSVEKHESLPGLPMGAHSIGASAKNLENARDL